MIKMNDIVTEVGKDDGGERERGQLLWPRIKKIDFPSIIFQFMLY